MDETPEEPVPDVEDLLADLDDLEAEVTSEAAREEIDRTRALLVSAEERGLVASGTRSLDPGDAAEAFVGSVVFAAPLLVEDGIYDIASYLMTTTVAGLPVFLVANALFVVVMTHALLEWTGREKKEARTLFGLFPARVAMVLVVSFLVAAALMTVWGRVGDWHPVTEGLARVSVLWTVGSLGAALGDILSANDAPAG